MLIKSFILSILFGTCLLSQTITQVANINPGGASNPQFFFEYENKVYFQANDGTNGNDFYEWDGTNSPTLTFDINPSGNGNPKYFTNYSGTMFFRATQSSTSYEVYAYTGSGTYHKITDFSYGDNSQVQYLTTHDDKLYFSGIDAGDNELYSYDGNSVNLEFNINTGGSSSPAHLFAYSGTLFFQADNGNTDSEFYMLEEGSATYTYIDINPNTGSNPNSFVDFNGKIYFVATSENNGSELHKYDPDTRLVTRVTDISVGADNSLINDPTAYYDGSNTYLVFGASNNGAAGGSQFWYMDTAEQLNSITINNTKNSSPSSFVIDGTSLYFRADRTNQDLDIFVWNGPDGDDPLPAEADPSVDMNLQDGLYIFQDQIIFRAALDGSDYELLRFPLSSSPSESAPELYNLSAEATGSESATFYTDLYSGNASTTYSFFIGLSSNSYIDQESATISGSSSTVNVGIDATTLTPNEQYFVRASATNSVTWTQSDEVSFWTLETEPENHAEIGQVGEELTSISLTFSSADEIGADGYVLIRSSTAFDADDLPNDSQTYTENNTIGDAIVIEVIDITSTTTTLLEDLTSEKSWQFALVPYNIGDDNATINYFTDDIDSISGYTIPTLGEWLLVFGGSLLVIGVWFSRRTV